MEKTKLTKEELEAIEFLNSGREDAQFISALFLGRAESFRDNEAEMLDFLIAVIALTKKKNLAAIFYNFAVSYFMGEAVRSLSLDKNKLNITGAEIVQRLSDTSTEIERGTIEKIIAVQKSMNNKKGGKHDN